jgi:hypothetical protein
MVGGLGNKGRESCAYGAVHSAEGPIVLVVIARTFGGRRLSRRRK